MNRMYTVTAQNGDIYGVPASVIADNYATYYARQGYNYVAMYHQMLCWFDEGEYEFAEWAKNHMTWKDVRQHALLIKVVDLDTVFQNMWEFGDYKYRRR